MVCATELLHAANFCPVCGARLAAPPPDGSAATTPGNESPDVVLHVPVATTTPSVAYLPGADGPTHPQPDATPSAVEPNPHAATYAQQQHGVPEPYSPAAQLQQPAPHQTPAAAPPSDLPPVHPVAAEPSGGYAAQLAASLQGDLGHGPIQAVPPTIVTAGSHGLVPPQQQLVPPQQIHTNPFGDFFSDGPSAWLEDDADDDSLDVDLNGPRAAGTLLAGAAILLLIAAWIDWGFGVYRGAGGAESAPLLLVAMIAWIWYLTLPRTQQHRALLARHRAMSRFVERTARPIRRRTEGTMAVRSERDRYRAMRDERERRINSLGEAAQRSFRTGQLPVDLHAPAQRVLAIERQMLIQDSRIHDLVVSREQRTNDPASAGNDPASDAPDGGHPHR